MPRIANFRKVHILKYRQETLHVEAECNSFKINLKSKLKPPIKQRKGNLFSMLTHDFVTLANK